MLADLRVCFSICATLLSGVPVHAQVVLEGNVHDRGTNAPLPYAPRLGAAHVPNNR